MLKVIFVITLIAFLLFGCNNSSEKDQEIPMAPVIELPIEVDFTAPDNGCSRTVTFTTNKDWAISVADTKSIDWITVYPISGKAGVASVTIDVRKNETYDYRKANVSINIENLQKTIAVTQNQIDALILDKNDFSIDEKGGTFTFAVRNNVEYKVEIDNLSQNWISQVLTKGLNEESLTFLVQPTAFNNDHTYRKAEITISNSNKKLSEVLNVFQCGAGTKVVCLDGQSGRKLADHFSNDEEKAVKNLIVFGDINKSDFYFIRDNMTNLDLCDLFNTSTKEIPYMAFSNIIENYYASQISQIILPSNLEVIRESAFNGCNKIKSITLPASFKELKWGAFYNCENLETIEFNKNLSIIGVKAFYNCKKLKTVRVPNSVQTIEASAFESCDLLESVFLPEGLESIENSVFSHTNIKEILLPVSIKHLRTYCFAHCNNLENITGIADNLISIGDYAFINSKITEFTIPSSVRHIGVDVFYPAICLRELTCHIIEPLSFVYNTTNYSKTKLFVPSQSVSKYSSAEVWKNFMTINPAQ